MSGPGWRDPCSRPSGREEILPTRTAAVTADAGSGLRAGRTFYAGRHHPQAFDLRHPRLRRSGPPVCLAAARCSQDKIMVEGVDHRGGTITDLRSGCVLDRVSQGDPVQSKAGRGRQRPDVPVHDECGVGAGRPELPGQRRLAIGAGPRRCPCLASLRAGRWWSTWRAPARQEQVPGVSVPSRAGACRGCVRPRCA
jgi:hypothetical protein